MFPTLPGVKQFLQGRFTDAGHEMGPGLRVSPVLVTGGRGRVVGLVLFVGRQEIAKPQREVF